MNLRQRIDSVRSPGFLLEACRYALRVLIVTSLLLSTAYSSEAASASGTATADEDFRLYKKDGLSLRYPAHWSLAYDELDSLYADRDASFSPTEFSKVSVLIYNDNTIDEVKLANRFARILKLESSQNVEDYTKTPIDISGFKAVRLSWTNTLLAPVSSEMTIVKITKSDVCGIRFDR